MIDDPYRRTFASMTIILDNAMKKIVGQMQSLGYYDNSVMLVMSDNGGCPYSGGYNYPLRGAKQYLWEGGIRVNAFVHSPMLARARAARRTTTSSTSRTGSRPSSRASSTPRPGCSARWTASTTGST